MKKFCLLSRMGGYAALMRSMKSVIPIRVFIHMKEISPHWPTFREGCLGIDIIMQV